MKNRKFYFFVLVFALVSMSHLVFADVLETPNYTVNIKKQCGEYAVVCNKVNYVGVNKHNGQTIKLKGKTEHALCTDGKTPCRFIGYVFKNGKVSYHVSDSGDLTVMEASKVLLQETGTWK